MAIEIKEMLKGMTEGTFSKIDALNSLSSDMNSWLVELIKITCVLLKIIL